MQSRTALNKQISLRNFKSANDEDETKWTEISDVKELLIEMRTQELEERLCSKQVERLENDLATSSLGLKGLGKRNNTDQSNFRFNLIFIYNAAHPNPQFDTLWCPIIKRYCDRKLVTAAHIFVYRHGQDTMTAIFGQETSSDSFSPFNGLLMHTTAKNMFDKGYFIIVPYIAVNPLDRNPSADMIKLWLENEPKEYQVHICERDGVEMNKFISGDSGPTWRDLDGSKLIFKNGK